MLRIGEFAGLTRVSVRMLRHYDEVGLLPPAYVDGTTGYRYYRAAQLRTLNRILLLRDLGFGLREIADVLHGDDAAYRRQELELLSQLELTTARLGALQARRARPEGTDVVIRPVAAQRVATLTASPSDDIEELFYIVETQVSAHAARADRPPLTLIDGDLVTVAVPISRAMPEKAGVRMSTLPAATVACAVHNGPYDGLAGLLAHMVEWLTRIGRQPVGPRREVYLRFGAEPELRLPPTHLADADDPGYVTELQLPVRPSVAAPSGVSAAGRR
jgi:DNA-binding transcriptional MerR regulator